MELSELIELHHPIFQKMVKLKEDRLFGNPDTMAMHVGQGFEKYFYQSITIDRNEKKLSFAALCRVIAYLHDLDWAVLTMDCFAAKYHTNDVPVEDAMRLGSARLERMGLTTRHSAIFSIATSRSGHTHVLKALENTDGTYTVDDTDTQPHDPIHIVTGQDLMIFTEPSFRMLNMMSQIANDPETISLVSSVPFQTTKYASV